VNAAILLPAADCGETIAIPPIGTTALRDGQPTGQAPEGTGNCTTGRADADSLTRAVWIGARARRGMFVCDAPPLGRRLEHRIDRLTPIRPQVGRLFEHDVSANGLTRLHSSALRPAGRSVPTAEPSRLHAPHTTNAAHGDDDEN
jgi:hypothetical protein